MSRIVWKQPLSIGETKINMPVGSKVLAVQIQNYEPCMWFEFPSENIDKTEERVFQVYGTGHTIPHIELKYVATFQQANGNFVGHVYEFVEGE